MIFATITNGDGTVINPNDQWKDIAPGLRAWAGKGSDIWKIEADDTAVGKTYVFWAHGGRYKEYIFATINKAGTYNIGTKQNGMNHLSYLGVSGGYITREIIGYGYYRFLIAYDPSGYVFEAVPGNRLEGVTATVYEDGNSTPWDANELDQINPQITNEQGRYGWDVPEANWLVRFSKAGYANTESISMPVPPEHTEVNIGMKAAAPPSVINVKGYTNGIEILFSQYMKLDNLAENIRITNNGSNITGRIESINRESNYLEYDYLNGTIQNNGLPGHTANEEWFASAIRFVPDQLFTPGEVRLIIESDVKNCTNTTMASPYNEHVSIQNDLMPTILTAHGLSLDFGASNNIDVTVGLTTAGKTLKAVSSNPAIVDVQSSVAVGTNGKASVGVTGLLPGTATITLELDGTLLTTAVEVSVGVPLAIREELGYSEDVINYSPPVITSASGTTVSFGTGGTFQVAAAGTPSATFSARGMPSDVSIDSSGLINISNSTTIGSHIFMITASNNVGSAAQVFTLLVSGDSGGGDSGGGDSGGGDSGGGDSGGGDSGGGDSGGGDSGGGNSGGGDSGGGDSGGGNSGGGNSGGGDSGGGDNSGGGDSGGGDSGGGNSGGGDSGGGDSGGGDSGGGNSGGGDSGGGNSGGGDSGGGDSGGGDSGGGDSGGGNSGGGDSGGGNSGGGDSGGGNSGGGNSGGGNSNGSSSSRNGNDRSRADYIPRDNNSSNTEYITEAKIRTAIQQTDKDGSKLVKTRSSYDGSHSAITPDLLALMNGYEYIHDTTGRTVQVRVQIPQPAKVNFTVYLCGSVTGNEVDKVKTTFEKWYSNDLRVVDLHQHNPWGQTIKLAALVNFTGMNTQNLYFYSYDKETNKYKKIETTYRFDDSGYIHFTSPLAGAIIISGGLLSGKGK